MNNDWPQAPHSPVPEDFRYVPQVSFYGASKLAAEGLIGAYCEMYGFTAVLGRWVHIRWRGKRGASVRPAPAGRRGPSSHFSDEF